MTIREQRGNRERERERARERERERESTYIDITNSQKMLLILWLEKTNDSKVTLYYINLCRRDS